MGLDDLRAAVRAYRKADREVGRLLAALTAARLRRAGARQALAERITRESATEMRQQQIAAETGYTRERIRQIVKAEMERVAAASPEPRCTTKKDGAR